MTDPVSNKRRVICLDAGTKTCGIAITDPLGITVQPLCVLRYKGEHDVPALLKQLDKLFFDLKPAVVVVGYPCTMSGAEGSQAQKIKRFIQALKNHLKKQGRNPESLQWVLWDERLTSREAEQFLKQQGASAKKTKNVIDKMAAVFILKSYLEERDCNP